MPAASVVIPTYNRPGEIADCLKSLLGQTVMPLEVVIIDDGNLPEPPMKAEFEARGVGYVFAKKDKPGLTESRNLGVELAKGEVICFLDDDTILHPDYLERLLAVYDEAKAQGRDVAGVAGAIANTPRPRLRDTVKRFAEMLFLAQGLSEGRALPSGFFVQYGATPFPVRRLKRVDFLPGGASSFHKSVFKDRRFTDRFRSLGLGEDKDFTLALARTRPLYLEPKARLDHLESPNMRPDHRRWGRMFLVGNYLLFTRHVLRHWWQWPLFWYATAGHILVRLLALAVFPNKGKWLQIRGLADAVGDIVAGRARLPGAGEIDK